GSVRPITGPLRQLLEVLGLFFWVSIFLIAPLRRCGECFFKPPDAGRPPWQAPVRHENFRHPPKEEAMKPVAVTAALLGGLCVFLIPPAYAAEGHAFVAPSDFKPDRKRTAFHNIH